MNSFHLVVEYLYQVTIRNFHLTINTKNNYAIEPGSCYFQGGGGSDLASFGGGGGGRYFLGFISGHNFLTLLSEVYGMRATGRNYIRGPILVNI